MTHREKRIWNAAKNRREIVEARLSRRDLMKLGLLTSAGYLVAKGGLSARADGNPQSPPTRPFVEPLPIPPPKTSVKSLTPAPTINPNTAINPATGIPYEGRTRDHQLFTRWQSEGFTFYEISQRPGDHSFHTDLPLQTIWGFDGKFPGPTYHARYGDPILVRNYNELPTDNGGFGINQVSTHLHNGHTPSESDGFPCDFFNSGQFYDQVYPNVLAGFLQQFPPNGDPREAMSTLWYHDHRVDFTSQNVYKGLAGFYLLFNGQDTGNEETGFRLPSGDFDVPMIFADKVFDQNGMLFFDLFSFDGIVGDKFTVNGKIQPFFPVHPRKYRLRGLNGGPSRFYQFFLTDPNNLNQTITFTQISTDGNLLPAPLTVSSVPLSVAERVDVVIDFSRFAGQSLYLENRLEQTNGRGPTGKILPAGQGDKVLQFRVVLPAVADSPPLPSSFGEAYRLPPTNTPVAATRVWRFERQNGAWAVNQEFFDCDDVRAQPKQGAAEIWVFQNNSGGWQHPIHIHFEEFQILSRNGQPPPANERGRKDVVSLGFNEEIRVFQRFRDFTGRYVMHCHNTVHEDHAMMIRFDIVP